MRNYLFDTGVFSLLFSEKLPEKWLRYWTEIRNGTKNLVLFEFLISELFYKNSLLHGFQKTTDRIMQIKSLGASRIVGIEDNEAFAVGKHMVSLRRLVYRMLIPTFLLSPRNIMQGYLQPMLELNRLANAKQSAPHHSLKRADC